MKRARIVCGALVAVTLSLPAAPAAAQATVGWDVAGFSSYVWRGLTLSSKPVLEPDLYLTVPVSGASFTVGGWSNIELGKYSPPAIGEGGGVSSFDLTEFDWWGEVGIPYKIATFTAGVTGYVYPNKAGLTKANNTTEIYGKVGLGVPLSPKLAMWYDFDKIKGAYFEGSISHPVKVGPAVSINLGALAGLSAGQEINTSDPTQSFNFTNSGLTHVDLSASSSFAAGPLSIAPALHVVFGVADNTKWTRIDPTTSTGFNSKSVKLWGGVTISWSHVLGAKAEEPEEK